MADLENPVINYDYSGHPDIECLLHLRRAVQIRDMDHRQRVENDHRQRVENDHRQRLRQFQARLVKPVIDYLKRERIGHRHSYSNIRLERGISFEQAAELIRLGGGKKYVAIHDIDEEEYGLGLSLHGEEGV